jgi:hypothetical protein
LSPESIKLVHARVDYQVKAGFARIVLALVQPAGRPPAANTQDLPSGGSATVQPPRGRMNLNLSFAVHKTGCHKRGLGEIIQQSGKRSEPVNELGKVLPWVLNFMVSRDDRATTPQFQSSGRPGFSLVFEGRPFFPHSILSPR